MSFSVNSFQLPNDLIDSGLLSVMSHNDIKCYLVIVRKTTGWHKEWDHISTTQLMDMTGIKKRQTVYFCIENLEKYGLVEAVKKPGKVTKYRLKVVPSNGTSTVESSTVERYIVVPPNGTGTSTVERYTTKDTHAKDTNTKDMMGQKQKKQESKYQQPKQDQHHPNSLPTQEQVIAMGKRLKMDSEACTKFYNHYSARGWRDVLDYVPLLRNWKMNDLKYANKNNKPNAEERNWG